MTHERLIEAYERRIKYLERLLRVKQRQVAYLQLRLKEIITIKE
jgi:hypothetical protein